MYGIETTTALLGWCSLINIGLLAFFALTIVAGKRWLAELHASLFGLDPARLNTIYFNFLALYKILIIVFNLVPYLALRLVF